MIADVDIDHRRQRRHTVRDRDAALALLEQRVIVLGITDADDVVPGQAELVEGDLEAGALPINADAAVMATTLSKGQELRLTLAPGRAAYLVPAKGSATVTRGCMIA